MESRINGHARARALCVDQRGGEYCRGRECSDRGELHGWYSCFLAIVIIGSIPCRRCYGGAGGNRTPVHKSYASRPTYVATVYCSRRSLPDGQGKRAASPVTIRRMHPRHVYP